MAKDSKFVTVELLPNTLKLLLGLLLLLLEHQDLLVNVGKIGERGLMKMLVFGQCVLFLFDKTKNKSERAGKSRKRGGK
jgi:hypothetical protein